MQVKTAMALCLALAFLQNAAAETVYVIDKLLVGVHSEKSLDSPIIKAFPTGTKLEVLSRDGDLAQIRGPEGVSGWVDAVYLSKEQPAALLVEHLEAQNRKLVEDLKSAQTRIEELGVQSQGAADAAQLSESGKITELGQQLDNVRRQLESERTRAGELQSKLATVQNTPVVDAKALADLTQENIALKHELEEVQIKAIRASESPQAPVQSADHAKRTPGAVLLAGRWSISATTVIGILFGVLVVGFIVGIWLMDARQRRRLGGFRI
jgi:SH3 domain protein